MNTKATTTIVIIILLALGAWAVFGTQSEPTIPPIDLGTDVVISDDGIITTDSGETIDTSEWVTYRNEEMGFEVKHPEGWEAEVLEHGDSTNRSTTVLLGLRKDGAVKPIWNVTKHHTQDNLEEFNEAANREAAELDGIEHVYYNRKTSQIRIKNTDAMLVVVETDISEDKNFTSQSVSLLHDDRVWSLHYPDLKTDYRPAATVNNAKIVFETFTFIDSSE